MAARRLLDLVALFNASRGIAQKHTLLRSRQLDVYSKTSSLARAVKNQTDRVTETVKAASFLASRLNEAAPAWVEEAEALKKDHEPSINRNESAAAGAAFAHSRADPQQAQKTSNCAKDVASEEGESKVQQEKAGPVPLRDGTVPAKEASTSSSISTPSYSAPLSSSKAEQLQRQAEQQIPSNTADGLGSYSSVDGHDADAFYAPQGHTSLTLSSLPRVKIPRHSENSQGGNAGLNDLDINSDSFYSPTSNKVPSLRDSKANQERKQVDEKIPEGVNTDIFNNPRVAKLLGSKITATKKDGLPENTSNSTPLPEKREQAIFSGHSQAQESPSKVQSVSDRENMSSTDGVHQDVTKLAEDIAKDSVVGSAATVEDASQVKSNPPPYQMRESKVPSTRLGRLWNYGGLAAGMFGGAISESVRRVTGSGSEGSYMLSPANMDRLVAKLSRMRGAALKLGQMISFQDTKMLPPAIHQVLQRVQDSADYMPVSQRNKVLFANLGPDWRDLFSAFEDKPLAAASIGQVHSAVLKSTRQRVAVKVQYPGVADSIDSDLNNLSVLLNASRLLPRGLFLDKTIANAQIELKWECDYIREAECSQRFQELLADETDTFIVPKIFSEASGKEVLTMEYLEGVGVTKAQNLTQEQKDWIGTQILRLCLREITEFRFMQTDPNWTNFLFNAQTNKLELLDFGASREYPSEFILKYTQLLAAASKTDHKSIRDIFLRS